MKICLTILFACLLFITSCSPSAAQPAEGKLRVIAEVYPPYNFIDKDGNVTGQSVEIVQAVLQKSGITASVEVMPLSDALDLALKKSNIAVFSINRTPTREGLYKWVGPIGDYRQVFYALKGSSILVDKLEDAKAVAKIGVYKGDAGNQFLASHGFTNLDENPDDLEALKKLVDNRVQLWLGNKGGLAVTARQAGVRPDELVEFPVVVTQADLYVAISKDVPDSTVAALQKTLDSLKLETDSDGKTAYGMILAKYDDFDYLQSLLE